jgi:hypothetical protein
MGVPVTTELANFREVPIEVRLAESRVVVAIRSDLNSQETKGEGSA